VRYWIAGEDEDYDREFERATRSGQALPAPVSLSDKIGIALLTAIEVVLIVSLIAALR